MAVDGNSVVKGTEMKGLSYRGRERFLLGIHDTVLTSQTRPLTHVLHVRQRLSTPFVHTHKQNLHLPLPHRFLISFSCRSLSI